MLTLVASLMPDRSRTFDEDIPIDPERARLVDEIRGMNPSATREFLGRFRQSALELYLEHLRRTRHEPRGRAAVWRRPADTPAIVTRSRGE